MEETFVRCQGRSSSINEDCRVVAYASDGLATSSMAWASIKLEDGGAGGAESPERAEGIGSADRTDDGRLYDGMDGGTASRKRGAASAGGGSVPKRAKCEHGRQKSDCKECGGSGICAHGRNK